ncbi:MAG: transcriptional repressor [Actinobacteria bacterium]|nr:transcriptional repressor [Actinomycetota bacterium]
MAVEVNDIHLLVERRMRDTELVYTKGRREIVEMLATITRPTTMQELLDRRPRLNQGSMYRNMTDLETAGVVQKVIGADDRTRYELAEHLIGHHHHSICSQCGAVDDFTISSKMEKSLEAALERALGEAGFHPTAHRLDVIGICASCAA